MTIEEKLQHFYDTSVGEAHKEALEALEAHKASLNEQFEQHKQHKLADADAQIKAETENARREINKALSAEQLTIKRNWTKKQNEMKEKLFVEVKDKLEAFMATPEYEDFLCRKIQEAIEFAGEDEIFIFLSSSDSSKLHSLTARCGFPLRIGPKPFMGGVKAAIPKRNIVIDNSFLEAFTSMRREFTFDGGLKHE